MDVPLGKSKNFSLFFFRKALKLDKTASKADFSLLAYSVTTSFHKIEDYIRTDNFHLIIIP